MAATRAWTRIDFEQDGKQSDYMRVPFSSDKSAYGWIPVPMICIRNGEGPTALLTAGNHGDEYEGQIALLELARTITAEEIRGRIIILPALNYPAVVAGRRVSPLDEGNLNRLFPGDANGGPTAMIAHYVETVLFPLSDIVIDLHSGGKSLDHYPVALARPGLTPETTTKIRALLEAFGAPYSVVTTGEGGGAGSTLYAAAEQHGIPALTTELGSGGTLSARGLSIAVNGVRRVLKTYGIAPNVVAEVSPGTKFMRSLSRSGSIYAPRSGLFEPHVECGETVVKGQDAGLLHSFDNPLADPERLVFEVDGVVICRRFPTLTERGDCLYSLMVQAG
ncbi:succinylglutamate desuccinylase/aspartoacylase family protein [Rhizobium sp. TRM95796]|uniref:succinylglutamate desuccinylase/aspartoacylase family protein n=1 Tax=Rhizobium sp. TRM95796 TaxID=2979862 RepID=UPI0021E711DF|nr:succinylglutamate desuccinylase/aspartoacylase family protein [Rhizobium sp. TRM95796]MCV3768130.1 succinylglutamate desuccinylase/aspartoacylase family protein [Rhizobium sp. TRM95796]